MSGVQRYGIFRIGRRWRLASDDSTQLDFITLTDALAATDILVRAHQACGNNCEVVFQDRSGRLVSLPEAGPAGLELIAEEIIAEDYREPSQSPVDGIGTFVGTA